MIRQVRFEGRAGLRRRLVSKRAPKVNGPALIVSMLLGTLAAIDATLPGSDGQIQPTGGDGVDLGRAGAGKARDFMETKLLHLSQIPVASGSPYEGAIKGELLAGKHEARLGKAVGMTQFGVNHVTLDPGAISALRHWHEAEDEFVLVVKGEVTLVDDNGEHPLTAGRSRGFRPGSPTPITSSTSRRPRRVSSSWAPGGQARRRSIIRMTISARSASEVEGAFRSLSME